jgi:predicted component of type VI protein secretion system
MQVSWVYILFTALVAVAMLIQAGVLLGILIAMKTSLKRIEKIAAMAEEHAIPALTTAKNLLDSVSPQLKAAADNVAAASETLRTQADHVNDTLDVVLRRTEAQAERVDEMITGTLNTVADATAAVQRTVNGPVRQISALLNGIRAGLDVLRGRERQAHAAADGDHFV